MAKDDRVLRVFSDGDDADKYVAYDAADAHQLQLETIGEHCAELDDWHALPGNKKLTIDYEDESVNGLVGKHTKTCDEWCAINGRGFLCSTEF